MILHLRKYCLLYLFSLFVEDAINIASRAHNLINIYQIDISEPKIISRKKILEKENFPFIISYFFVIFLIYIIPTRALALIM